MEWFGLQSFERFYWKREYDLTQTKAHVVVSGWLFLDILFEHHFDCEPFWYNEPGKQLYGLILTEK